MTNAAAQSAPVSYPDPFVANLKNFNNCIVPETCDVVFDDPGKANTYGDGLSASSNPSFERGACTGVGSQNAQSSSSYAPSSGNSEQWKGQTAGSQQDMSGHDMADQDMSSQSMSSSQIGDGMWHLELWSRNSRRPTDNSQ